MSKKKPEAQNAGWNCQECGSPMHSYIEKHNEICECPNCGFTVIRRKY